MVVGYLFGQESISIILVLLLNYTGPQIVPLSSTKNSTALMAPKCLIVQEVLSPAPSSADPISNCGWVEEELTKKEDLHKTPSVVRYLTSKSTLEYSNWTPRTYNSTSNEDD